MKLKLIDQSIKCHIHYHENKLIKLKSINQWINQAKWTNSWGKRFHKNSLHDGLTIAKKGLALMHRSWTKYKTLIVGPLSVPIKSMNTFTLPFHWLIHHLYPQFGITEPATDQSKFNTLDNPISKASHSYSEHLKLMTKCVLSKKLFQHFFPDTVCIYVCITNSRWQWRVVAITHCYTFSLFLPRTNIAVLWHRETNFVT